jgi:hypothetical protein
MSANHRPARGAVVAHPRKQERKSLQALESHDCRWPIGDPRLPDFHFCGKRQAAGRPYCQQHWDLSLQPERPRVPARVAA